MTKTSWTTDSYHGVAVDDPYRWLEDHEDGEVAAWATAQTQAAADYVHGLPGWAQLRARLHELSSSPTRGVPVERADKVFDRRNDGQQEQDALWVTDPHGERMLLDPAASMGANTALIAFEPSPDGRKVVAALSEGGTDWMTVLLLDVETGTTSAGPAWVKAPVFTWLPDSSGFSYTSFAPPLAGRSTAANHGLKVLLRTLDGEDRTLWVAPGGVAYAFPRLTDDGRFLVVEELRGSSMPASVIAVDMTSLAVGAVTGGEGPFRYVGFRGDEFFVQSHANGSNGRVLALRPGHAEPREVVPESTRPLPIALGGGAHLMGDWIVTVSTAVMSHRVHVTHVDTGESYDLALPGSGVVSEFTQAHDGTGFCFSFASFTTPPSVLQHEFETRTTRMLWRDELPGHDPSAYVIEEVDVTSADGTQIPMHVIRHVKSSRDQARPTILNGYGGFGVVFALVGFQVGFVPWLEAGGILAIAGLRGGGEYGEAWHQQGMRGNKQRVFDDAAACAEWLIASGTTSSHQLVLNGKSNGGLLAAALLVQRPELFCAVIPEVPMTDMLRYHHFASAAALAAEFGTADEPDDFAFLRAYSPLHNLKEGRDYPPVLVTTADGDNRLPPGVHAYKFVATLRAVSSSPVLLRVQEGAGHAMGRSRSVQVDERSDIIAFAAGASGLI